MARDDYGSRDREREERFGQGERTGSDRQGSDRGRDPYGGAMFGTERDSVSGRPAQQGDERDLGYGGYGGYGGGERSQHGQGAQPGRQGQERYEGGGGQDRSRDAGNQPGMGGWMGREGGGRYGGRPEDDMRPMMRYDRQDYEGGYDRQGLSGGRGAGRGMDASYDRDDARYDSRGAQGSSREGGMMRGHEPEYGGGYARDYGREGNYGRQGGGMSGRPGGAGESGIGGLSGAGYAGSQGGLTDRNPGQGFGAFGFSNADESGARIREGQQRGGFAGRGPRNYQRSDERIRDDVCERLTRHHEIDASDVDIDVREGIVTLSGKVEDKHTKRLAEDIAEEVMGVRDVRNELKTARGGLLSQLFGGDDAEEARTDSSRAEREVSRQASRDRGSSAATSGASGGVSGGGDVSVTRSRGAGGSPGTTGNATTGDVNTSRRGRTE